MDCPVLELGLDDADRPNPWYGGADALPNAPELIRLRAYELFCMRVAYGLLGDAASDWAQAEREMASAPCIALIDSEIEPSRVEVRADGAPEPAGTADFEPGYEFFHSETIAFERGAP